MASKMSITFDGFDELAERLDGANGNLNMAVDDALTKTKQMITPNLESAMQRHNNTYKTVGSLNKDWDIDWVGTVASVSVGFKIRNGGLPSIFLMYGTPKMKKDQRLYNAIKGTKTKKDIAELQEKVMRKYLTLNKKGGKL